MLTALAASPAMSAPLAALLVAGCVAAAFAFLLLVVVPLVTLVTHRQASAPEIIAQEPGPYPTPAHEYFDEIGPRLADLGFAETQRWTFGRFVTNVAAELCSMVDRRRNIAAVVNVVHVKRKGVFRLHSRFIEFSTRAADGRAIVTTGTPTPLLYTEIGPRRIYPFPSIVDPALLLQVHEKLVARDFRGAALTEPSRPAEFPDRVREVIAASHEWQIARGLMRSPRGGSSRLTFKGAFLFTWAAIPPGRWMVRRRIAREEKRLLRELGIAGP